MATKKTMHISKIQNDDNKIPIKWVIPEHIITRFASNIVLQFVEGYFKISFFELKPDIRINPEHRKQTEVVAECVSSIVVPPDKLKSFIDLLNRQYEKFEKAIDNEVIKKNEEEFSDTN